MSHHLWKRGWGLRVGFALAAAVAFCRVSTIRAAQTLVPEPSPSEAVIVCREERVGIILANGRRPIDTGTDGRDAWILVPATAMDVWINFEFLGSGHSTAVELPLAGGTTYRLVTERPAITNRFGTYYFWFENADTGVRVSYRFAILPSRR